MIHIVRKVLVSFLTLDNPLTRYPFPLTLRRTRLLWQPKMRHHRNSGPDSQRRNPCSDPLGHCSRWCARLYRIYDAVPRFSVQCHLRIKYIVDNFKRVNLAACRPIRRNRIGPECGPHGTPGKVSVRQSLVGGQAARERGP